MTPAIYKIKDHYKGDTFNGIQFTLENSETSTPVDLTGVIIRTQFRQKQKTGAVRKEITTGSGITITDAVNGIFQIDSFVIDWNPDNYYYDIQLTFIDNSIKTYISGTIKIIQDVTI